ncbi:response regulator transcription factor [Imhoffiella purpurea]|uniref:Two component transcriptional regulator, winged helix family n=1 Tax=Imhoffiella purpurea TaxID=1249627 RepID=W9VHS8_9GAMM|nr:response regulator transcription factor [Imhoffiella purpurea]EXJ15602.1 two component transcriptional regulator, winged helix family [Imhoffiella purpurea]
MRVLLVEDDDRVGDAVAAALEAGGFVVERSRDGEDAWFKGDTENYAAVVLDLGLPSMDGLSVLRRWRAAGQRMPVLILTARGDWSERVEGIDAGADDYLPKPFRMEELQARLRALIRRSAGQASALIEIGCAILDTRRMSLSLDGVPIHLSPQEYRLVSYLMQHAGRVVSQLELTEQLYAQDFERDSNAVEVLVGRVRRKLGADLIQTRRGFGYLVEPDGE